MMDTGRQWVAQGAQAAPRAWRARPAPWAQAARAGLLGLLVAGPVVVAQTNGPAGPTAYRCGNSYSSTPCPGGKAVDTEDARSAAQQREAQEVKRRDAALAEQMAADRRARERETAPKPAVGIGPPAAAPAPQHASTTTTTTKKKKKTTTKKPVTTKPQKLSNAG
jgi:hypothetical protein